MSFCTLCSSAFRRSLSLCNTDCGDLRSDLLCDLQGDLDRLGMLALHSKAVVIFLPVVVVSDEAIQWHLLILCALTAFLMIRKAVKVP